MEMIDSDSLLSLSCFCSLFSDVYERGGAVAMATRHARQSWSDHSSVGGFVHVPCRGVLDPPLTNLGKYLFQVFMFQSDFWSL